MNFAPLLLLLCITAVLWLPLCTVMATLLQLLHPNILQAFLSFCSYAWGASHRSCQHRWHDFGRRCAVAGTKSKSWESSVMENGKKTSQCLAAVSKKKKNVRWWREPHVPGMRQTLVPDWSYDRKLSWKGEHGTKKPDREVSALVWFLLPMFFPL